VEPEATGEANIDIAFESRYTAGSSILPSVLAGTNPRFVLRFRGDLRTYDASRRELTGGAWIVGPGCMLDLSGRDVSVIGPKTSVYLNAGEFPALKLAENHGFVGFTNVK
jgi:hypothetical protein